MRNTVIGENGKWPEELEKLVKDTMSHPSEEGWVLLTDCNNEMDRLNHIKLKGIKKPLHTFGAVDWRHQYGYILKKESSKASEEFYEAVQNDKKQQSLFSACSGKDEVQLKEGAYVVCTRTISVNGVKIANGTFGTVQTFVPADLSMCEDAPDDAEVSWWQKMHFLRTGNGAAEPVLNSWPLVEFRNLKKNGALEKVTVCVTPSRFEIQDVDTGTLLAKRIQLPICCAWAMTVHRAQGVTLPGVVVSMKSVFAYGQLYTACSRVRSFEKLRFASFNNTWMLASPDVKKFQDECEKSWVVLDNSSASADEASF